MKNFFTELYYFTIKNAWASLYGALLLFAIFFSHFVDVPLIANYDFIFIFAVLVQFLLFFFKLENLEEIKVIFMFHVVATVMELFKTHPDIASWSYPQNSEAFFVIATVPLFTGFLYSAVGSYISRIWDIFSLKYINYPKKIYTFVLAILIYINFFTHHFIYDFRYFLFLYILILFWKTKIKFTAWKKEREMNFILSGFSAAFFIWIAENIGSYSNVWLYPNQLHGFQMVSFQKIESWFLLLIISFVLVGLVKLINNK